MTEFVRLTAEGRPILGCFSFLPSPQVVEVLALGGLDFVIVDREHSPAGWQTVEEMIRAAEARGISALVRVGSNSREEILHALECGADGVVIPGISSAEQAAEAVRAMRYPPLGERGACPDTRAARYGSSDYPAFRLAANESRFLVLLIESAGAFEEIEAIAGAAGPATAYMLGRSDLAASLGCFGDPTAPQVAQAAREFVRRLHDVDPDSIIGMGLYEPAEAKLWYEEGCRFFWLGADASLFRRSVATAIEELGLD